MKTKNYLQTVMIAMLFAGIFITGCRKPDDKETQTASDFEQGQGVQEDASNMADAAVGGAGSGSFKTSPGSGEITIMSICATVTRDTVNHLDPDTVTIDFGTSNCLCIDSRYRRGIITIIHFGDRFTAGSYRTVTFNNYFVNDHHVEGIHSITANGNYSWTITGQNMKITRPDGKWHSWSSVRTRVMTAGTQTPLLRSDDVFSITGNINGTNSNGNTYMANITNALVRAFNCHWIENGTVEIIPSGKPKRTIDFGYPNGGACDDQASVTINGHVHPITLH